MKKLLFCMLILSKIAHINAFTHFLNHDSIKNIVGLSCVFAGSIGIANSININTENCIKSKPLECVVLKTSIQDNDNTLNNPLLLLADNSAKNFLIAPLYKQFKPKQTVEKPQQQTSQIKIIPSVPFLSKEQISNDKFGKIQPINKNILVTSALIYTGGLWLLYAGQK